MLLLNFQAKMAKSPMDHQMCRICLMAVIFLLRISEVSWMRWQYVVKLRVYGELCVRLLVVRAKNKKEWAKSQITQVPQLDNSLDPVTLVDIQRTFSGERSPYVFLSDNGSQLHVDEIQTRFNKLIVEFKSWLKDIQGWESLRKKRITFGSLRKSGMCLLSGDRFTSEEIAFFSRHSVKDRRLQFGNSVILDNYVKEAKANQLISRFKETFENLKSSDILPDISTPPVEI